MPQMRQHQTTDTGVPAHGGGGMAQTGMQSVRPYVADAGADKPRSKDAGGDPEVPRYGNAEHSEAHETRTRRRSSGLQEQTTEGEFRQVRTKKTALVNWPFMYSYKEDVCFVNKAQPKSKYQEACAIGVASF